MVDLILSKNTLNYEFKSFDRIINKKYTLAKPIFIKLF